MKTQSPRFVPIFFAWLILAAPGRSQSHLQTIHGQRPAAVECLKPVARCAPGTNLDLVLGLPLRNQPALARLLHDLYDPASPGYHHYLTSPQFAGQFGPSQRDYEEVIAFAASHGLRVTGTHANRTLLDVRGSVADIEKAFHVRMGVYRHPSEARTFHAPDADPSMDLAVPILGIGGLDDFLVPRPMNLKQAFNIPNGTTIGTGSGPNGAFLGNDFRAAYAPGVALNGAGQAVGLFELDGYYASDILEYENLAKLPNVALTNVLLDSFDGTPGSENHEVALDIDMAISMAPGLLEVIVYEGSTPNDVFNQMATDNQACQLSCSWGRFLEVDPVREQIFEQFAAQGQTMFQASGDSGAYLEATIAPSDDPYLTIVGGTSLTTSGPGGAWLAEAAWSGSGGGFSTDFPLPSWQQGLATPANQASLLYRNIPDVAAQADVNIWLIADHGVQAPIGGTSAAAPLWAGFAALANQQASAQGKPHIGFLNPTLYAIGRGAGYPAAMHDITTGNNTNGSSPTGFFAVPGYDLCTGWGTPAGSNLINALITPPDPLQIYPAAILTAAGAAGGPFSPASLAVGLTNIGSNSLNWAATSATPWLSVFPISGAISTNGSGQLVTLSLNSAASSLPPASYTASVWFTNLSDGFAQSRQLLLNVSIASTLPVIVSQPQSRTAPPGASVSFTVGAVGSAPLSYQWQKNSTNLADGGNIFGSTNTTLSVNNVSAADAGTYSVIVSNSLNRASSAGAVLTVASLTSPGVAFSTLYSFTGAGDGGVPNGLMQATNGDFYGTTQNGGASNAGTIFQMAPSGAVGTLYAFGIGDGPATPSSALAQGPDGLLYGVSTDGGANAWGTIYKTTTNGIVTNVVSFDLGLGVDPDQTLTLGVDGNFYGTTPSAGSGDGNVFCLATNGALTFLATFDETNGLLANQLTQGADGSLYGTTFEGGGTGNGAIFNLTTNGLFTSLYSFSETNGGFLPEAGLAQTPDGTFYGTTFEGGVYGYGTVFAMTPLGEVTTVYSFTGGSDGGHPAANLILAGDGNFYGTTANGGAYDDGTVFKMAPGNAPVTLATFDGYNGANPQSPLVQGTDGNFYGTTPNGGADGNGVIFRVNINSPSLQITGQPPDQTAFLGANAVFSVAVAGNPPIFYQWRKNGANLTDGLNISGSSTRVLTVSNVSDFDAAFYSVIVSNASGSAVSSNAFLEVIASPPQIVRPPVSQTVSVGGSATFAVTAVGDLPLSYQWQLNSTNMTNGANVFGAETSCLTITNLTQLSNGVYSVIVRNEVATATASAVLTVYPVSVSGTVMWSLHWFTGGSDGGTPNGLAVGSNGLLYGTTQSGGVSGGGTIFSITTNGVFNTLVSFGATNGANPEAALTQAADGDLYGVSAGGGSFSDGTVFKMTPAGALTSLFSFSNKSSLNPYVALVQASNGSLYGATANGNRGGDGNIFEMATNGAPGVLYSFTGGLDGNEPIGALTQATDGNFYGMTTAGGSNGFGGIFRMTPGGMLTNIYCFTGGADGSNPFGALVQGTDGYLYGVTRRNIISNLAFYGEVFKVSTNGALTILHTNNPFVFGDGAHPFAGLLQATDGNFYGSTLYSEVTNFGTLFRITSTGVYTTLSSFNNSDDGSQPESAMVQGPDGALYGTTTYGGPYGKGTVFRMAFTSSPQITVQPVNQTNLPGAGALFTVAVVGAPPLGYQWQFNGTNLTDAPGVSGSASRVLMLNNIAPSNAGNYAVIITNALGSVSSSDALLVVESPPAFLSAVQADGGLMLTWSATPGAAYQVQSTSDLASLNWANVGSPVTAVNSTASAVMPASPASQQFYRVIMLP